MEVFRQPQIWVLQGPKTGDNAQARELARRIGLPSAIKTLDYNFLHHLPNLVLGSSVTSVRSDQRRQISPPWPRLVICAGKRAVPVALWIKQQSSGHTKIVHLGRPRVPLGMIDLVITTPQYGLPSIANVIERPFPLASPPANDSRELNSWREKFATLPRPWLGVLVGGSIFPLYLDNATAAELADYVRQRQGSGSALVSTSPRTGLSLSRTLADLIQQPAYVHVFGEGQNPHQAILALADSFVVTSDSMSMMAEVAETGKPFEIFDLPSRRFAPSWSAKRGIGKWLAQNGLLSPPRDPRKIAREPKSFDDEKVLKRIRTLIAEN